MSKTSVVLCAQAEPNQDGVDFAAVALTESFIHLLNGVHKDLLLTNKESTQVSSTIMQWFGQRKKVAVVEASLVIFREGVSFFGFLKDRDLAVQADWIFGEDFELSRESIKELANEKGQILLEVCASGGAEQEEDIERLKRDVESTNLSALDLGCAEPMSPFTIDQLTR